MSKGCVPATSECDMSLKHPHANTFNKRVSSTTTFAILLRLKLRKTCATLQLERPHPRRYSSSVTMRTCYQGRAYLREITRRFRLMLLNRFQTFSNAMPQLFSCASANLRSSTMSKAGYSHLSLL